ncbi:uncharacterized protein LOC117125404 isoform X1 [Anneissia japonica]|uniref:uncharacterized protein LOC117125404 isoform X1 n=1 Tax=Anneissia japonica TaxID=1529436 RepID=UPI00142586DB|nr:uncharacterized protein LOC117125404 isoform X1 [Anneissia japonica]
MESEAAVLNDLKAEFISLTHRVPKNCISEFTKVVKEWLENVDAIGNNNDVFLKAISEDIRNYEGLPADAVMDTEKVSHPDIGQFSGKDPSTVVHVDKFLYDDDAVDQLCEDGRLSRNYCLDCQSHRTEPLTFISHSASIVQLKYIFNDVLPDLTGKVLVDIGSRLGPILYGGYYYSNSTKIVGIEVNGDLCRLQNYVIEKYQMAERVKIVCANVMDQEETLSEADVVVMHNVFKFFASKEQQVKIWEFLSKSIRKKGGMVVTIPSIEEMTDYLKMDIDMSSWVDEVPLVHDHIDLDPDDIDDLARVHLYRVV